MHGRFKYEKLSEYPHMGPQDAALWERFIDTHPDAYETVDYDMHVGEGAAPPLDTPPNAYTDDQKHLTKKRIDVCGYKKNGTVDCIEVRPRAGSSAVGAVMVNHELLRESLPGAKYTRRIITDKCQADMARLAALFNIEIVELDAPAP